MPVITIAGNDGISVEKKREMVKKVSHSFFCAFYLEIIYMPLFELDIITF